MKLTTFNSLFVLSMIKFKFFLHWSLLSLLITIVAKEFTHFPCLGSQALKDAGLDYGNIEQAVVGYCYGKNVLWATVFHLTATPHPPPLWMKLVDFLPPKKKRTKPKTQSTPHPPEKIAQFLYVPFQRACSY